MRKNELLKVFILVLILGFSVYNPTFAAGDSAKDLKKAEGYINTAIESASDGNLTEAENAYDQYNKTWRIIEEGVKEHSHTAYRDIESNMGKVVYAFTLKKPDQVVQALNGLKVVNEKYSSGGYPQESVKNEEELSLDDYIGLLQNTKKNIINENQSQALDSIMKASDSWLSVEGVVVAQSSKVYGDSERDLVTIQAMLSENPPNYEKATTLIENMIEYLTPLASKSEYTYWDAAMILLREGLEALLVVIALLSFVKKSDSKKGKKWIYSGVLAGLVVSIVLAVVVKLVISSGAFGNNNALIAGWTGIFAAAMLLYMSYWLHSQSNIADWNRYIREKSQAALSTGKLITLGSLSFLAVFREGTETVLFYIGMANSIKMQSLLVGFLIGAGLLGIIGFLMIYVGFKLPLRPFFMVSSLIVFYLCIKFTGMGIHSLQLAGLLPTTNNTNIPSLEFFALYPSWESTIPQVILLIGAAIIILMKKHFHKKVTIAKNN